MAPTGTVSLKLLVESTDQRVLFAEAGKDFVDFLFSILSLPVGAVTGLLTKQDIVGCLGNLYVSLESLSETYIQPTANKDTLLKPMVSNYTANVPRLLPNLQSSTSTINLYRCNGGYSTCRTYIANDSKSICPTCDSVMSHKATFVNPPERAASSSDEGGYVKGVVTYMIMDDLVVRPMSTISCITLLNKFSVKDVGVLEEKAIDFGMDEGVKLLKASMQSKSVLTDVFLGKKVGQREVTNPLAVYIRDLGNAHE
ncbi:DNA polymerase zeta catalytic subunit, putative [Theobroma cacao]|uniref:DNA polymerase zeta catalytic subunit, putative n=1 Tax=Theobroma cacao TaxID=3641 RepID=A0A061FU96_THECC|nr:DNA polymerase zeta catalytic subunit, putative [Theobroma cacao]